MPSKPSFFVALADIRDHILFIRHYISGMHYDDFLKDTRSFHAVTRCLEVISEASRRLPDALKDRHPNIPWRSIAAAGNIYRHDYEDVAEKVVWATAHHLDDLMKAVESELALIQ